MFVSARFRIAWNTHSSEKYDMAIFPVRICFFGSVRKKETNVINDVTKRSRASEMCFAFLPIYKISICPRNAYFPFFRKTVID